MATSNAADLLRILRDIELRGETLDAIDRLIEQRRADAASAAYPDPAPSVGSRNSRRLPKGSET